MSRASRDARLESRTARVKATQGKRVWRTIGKGLALGYRKGKNGGVWYARFALPDNKYRVESLGIADDNRDADNIEVFDYYQAQNKIMGMAGQKAKHKAKYTVENAMDDYLEWFKANRKSYSDTKNTIEAHIKPELKDFEAGALSTQQIRKWHQALVTSKEIPTDDAEGQRRAKATANRILTVLKAALNHAWHEGLLDDAEAWRKVKPFRQVDTPKIRYLTEKECKRLLNACPDVFRNLVRAALLTGCRYGELVGLKANDYNPDSGTLYIRESKSGKSRHVPLTVEGQEFFERITAGQPGSTLAFTRPDGDPWGKSHQSRPMKEACKTAKITPPASFHILRHTYGSLLAMKGVPLQVIAQALGHSDTRMTERHYAHLQPNYVADTIRAHLPSFGLDRDGVVSLKEKKNG